MARELLRQRHLPASVSAETRAAPGSTGQLPAAPGSRPRCAQPGTKTTLTVTLQTSAEGQPNPAGSAALPASPAAAAEAGFSPHLAAGSLAPPPRVPRRRPWGGRWQAKGRGRGGPRRAWARGSCRPPPAAPSGPPGAAADEPKIKRSGLGTGGRRGGASEPRLGDGLLPPEREGAARGPGQAAAAG